MSAQWEGRPSLSMGPSCGVVILIIKKSVKSVKSIQVLGTSLGILKLIQIQQS